MRNLNSTEVEYTEIDFTLARKSNNIPTCTKFEYANQTAKNDIRAGLGAMSLVNYDEPEEEELVGEDEDYKVVYTYLPREGRFHYMIFLKTCSGEEDLWVDYDLDALDERSFEQIIQEEVY